MEDVKERVVFKTDANGNVLYTEGNAIFLQMKNDEQRERIGSFDLANRMIIMNKEHFDFNVRFACYPFNFGVLAAAQTCDTVRLICPEGRFHIPISQILMYGTHLIYPKTDLSRELYIELSLIKKFPAPAG